MDNILKFTKFSCQLSKFIRHFSLISAKCQNYTVTFRDVVSNIMSSNEEEITPDEYEPSFSDESIKKLEEIISSLITSNKFSGLNQIEFNLSEIDDNNRIREEIENKPFLAFSVLNGIASNIIKSQGTDNFIACVHINDLTKQKTASSILPIDVEKIVSLPMRVINANDIEFTAPSDSIPGKSSKYAKVDNMKAYQILNCNDIASDGACKVILSGNMVGIIDKGECAVFTGIIEAEKNEKIFKPVLRCLSLKNIMMRSAYCLCKNDADIVQKMMKSTPLLPALVSSIAQNSGVSLNAKLSVLLALTANLDSRVHVCIMGEHSAQINNLMEFAIRVAGNKAVLKSDMKSDCIIDAAGGLLIIDTLQALKKHQLTFIEAVETGFVNVDCFTKSPADFSSISFCSLESNKLQNPLTEFLYLETANLFSIIINDESAETNRRRTLRQLTPRSTPSSVAREFVNWDDREKPLEERLKSVNENADAFFSEHEIKVFCAYARTFINPTIDDTVLQKIRECSYSFNDESAVRKISSLAKARAACELRDTVYETDVDEVCELIQSLTVNRATPKKGRRLSKKTILNNFINALKRSHLQTFSQRQLQDIFIRCNCESAFQSVDDLIDILSSENVLLLCPGGTFRLSNRQL